MQVGVLAVQGAFAEHEHVLSELGVPCIELRNAGDLNKPYDALILPGGESTVQGKLLRDSDMFDTIKSQIEGGIPVLATCAGLILLAQHIEGDDTVHIGTLPVTVKRNPAGPSCRDRGPGRTAKGPGGTYPDDRPGAAVCRRNCSSGAAPHSRHRPAGGCFAPSVCGTLFDT